MILTQHAYIANGNKLFYFATNQFDPCYINWHLSYTISIFSDVTSVGLYASKT